MTIDERKEYRDMMLQQFMQHEDHLRQLRQQAGQTGTSERAASHLEQMEKLIQEGKGRIDELEGDNWEETKPFLDRKLEQMGKAFDRASREIMGR